MRETKYQTLVETLPNGAQIWVAAENDDISPAQEVRQLGLLPAEAKSFIHSVRAAVKQHGRWGWCTIVVNYVLNGITGEAHLGCCCYNSAEDFKENSGYYADKLEEAQQDWQSKQPFTDTVKQTILANYKNWADPVASADLIAQFARRNYRDNLQYRVAVINYLESVLLPQLHKLTPAKGVYEAKCHNCSGTLLAEICGHVVCKDCDTTICDGSLIVTSPRPLIVLGA